MREAFRGFVSAKPAPTDNQIKKIQQSVIQKNRLNNFYYDTS
jgi:hypothetical protein